MDGGREVWEAAVVPRSDTSFSWHLREKSLKMINMKVPRYIQFPSFPLQTIIKLSTEEDFLSGVVKCKILHMIIAINSKFIV